MPRLAAALLLLACCGESGARAVLWNECRLCPRAVPHLGTPFYAAAILAWSFSAQ